MVKINLRDYYPDYYAEDTYIMVTEDVAEAFEESRRKNEALKVSDRRHWSPLNELLASNSTAMGENPITEIERNLRSQKLYDALSRLTPEQQRRIYAKFFLGLNNTEIAEIENCDKSAVRRCISRGIEQLRKFLKK